MGEMIEFRACGSAPLQSYVRRYSEGRMMARDTRVSEMTAFLESAGENVGDAMGEAVLRSMGAMTFAAALESVCQDQLAGLWPDSPRVEAVGESWERCAFCSDDFLPEAPLDRYCAACSDDLLGDVR